MCIKKNGAQGVHKVAQGQNSKNQGAQGLGDPSLHKAAQGFFQYFCLVQGLVRALCGHSLLSLCKQGARTRSAQGGAQGKSIEKKALHKAVAQGGAQGGAQGDAHGKMNTRQLGVHKADAQGAQGFFFLYFIVIL